MNPMDKAYIVRWQADVVNTKESLLPDCDKPYHKIKENLPHWEEPENLWNYALWIMDRFTRQTCQQILNSTLTYLSMRKFKVDRIKINTNSHQLRGVDKV